jgi:hypothetical protein
MSYDLVRYAQSRWVTKSSVGKQGSAISDGDLHACLDDPSLRQARHSSNRRSCGWRGSHEEEKIKSQNHH